MNDNRKGFTLIELLAVLVLLILVFSIALVAFTSYQESSKKSISKIEKTEILNAGTAYFKEFENSDDFTIYKDKKTNKSYSCVSVSSLIEMGYYDESVDFKASGIDKGLAVVRITKDENGVVSYTLIDNIKKDAETEALCQGFSFSGTLLEDSTNIRINDDKSDVKLAVDVKKRAGSDNSYLLKLTLDAKVVQEYNVSYPVYVLAVIDTSGSMSGTPYNNAVKSTANLSDSIVKDNSKSKVGLITFTDSAVLRRDFQNVPLTSYKFPSVGGGTNIDGGLQLAYVTFKNASAEIPSDAMKYVIFLTDGVDSCSRAAENSGCMATARMIRDMGVNLIFVGYGISYDNYKKMSSIDTTGEICPPSDYTDASGQKHCYYDSNSSTISSLFTDLSKTITSRVVTVKNGNLSIGINPELELLDSNGNKISNNAVSKKITFEDNGVTKFEFTYILNIEPENVHCSREDKCVIDLFSGNGYIELVYADNTKKKLPITSSPQIEITKQGVNYKN